MGNLTTDASLELSSPEKLQTRACGGCGGLVSVRHCSNIISISMFISSMVCDVTVAISCQFQCSYQVWFAMSLFDDDCDQNLHQQWYNSPETTCLLEQRSRNHPINSTIFSLISSRSSQIRWCLTICLISARLSPELHQISVNLFLSAGESWNRRDL